MTPFDKIGRKSPVEMYEKAIDLHGEFLADIHKTEIEIFNDLVDLMREKVHGYTENLVYWEVSDFKLYISRVLGKGIDRVNEHLQHVASVQRIDIRQKMAEQAAKESKTIPSKTQNEPVDLSHTGSLMSGSKEQSKTVPEKEIKIRSCVGCDEDYPLEAYPTAQGGTSRYCRLCLNKKNAGQLKEKPKPKEGFQICKRCDEIKPLNEFRKAAHGFTKTCTACISLRIAEGRAKQNLPPKCGHKGEFSQYKKGGKIFCGRCHLEVPKADVTYIDHSHKSNENSNELIPEPNKVMERELPTGQKKNWVVALVIKKDSEFEPRLIQEKVTAYDHDEAFSIAYAKLNSIEPPFCIVSKSIIEC